MGGAGSGGSCPGQGFRLHFHERRRQARSCGNPGSELGSCSQPRRGKAARPLELQYARIAPWVHRAKPLSPAFLVVARPITPLLARPDLPGPVTLRRGGPKGRLSKWRGGRHPGSQQMGYAFLKAIWIEVPRLGTSPTEASLLAILPSVCTLGTLGSEKEVLLAQAW